ncbi:MAG TPA: hypothetical protein V6D17_05730 [Candidatus Obscuribacterales bacterium]
MIRLREFLTKFLPKKQAEGTVAEQPKEDEFVCCSDKVHIAYRGVSDDRLYMAYSRKWSELKYFKQRGLRAFCVDCRRRVL